jgi:predicted DNA-binding protein
MSKTVKFTVSMPAAAFKELESRRRKTGRTRSQFIRDAVGARLEDSVRSLKIMEDTGEYKKEPSLDLTNLEERRRRALAAAGRFRSGVSDLSSKHDRYLEEEYAAVSPVKDKDRTPSRP